MKIPARGEIWHIDFNPTSGSEQQGKRPALVISEKIFNALGLMWVCPITQGGDFSRFAGFSVSLSSIGTQTTGVILCNQLRTIDYRSRKATFAETVPDFIIDDVLARIKTVLE